MVQVFHLTYLNPGSANIANSKTKMKDKDEKKYHEKRTRNSEIGPFL